MSESALAPPPAARRPVDRLHARRWWVLAVLVAVQLMDVMDTTIVNIALPSAQSDLGFSAGQRQWVVTGYSLAFGSLLLLGGRIADLVGARTTLLVGLLGFAAASALGGAAPTFEVLVVARVLQGALGAVLAPSALSLVTTTFTDQRERAKAFAVFGSAAGSGAAVGLVLGGVLTEYLDWRWGLYVNTPIALVSFVAALALVRDERERRATHLDLPGALTAVVGLAALVFGLDHAGSHGWTDGTTLGVIAGAVAALGLFVLVQARVASPLLPLRVVADRRRGGAVLVIGLSIVAMFSVFLFLIYYLQQVQGYSPLRSGTAFLPLIAGLVVSAAASSVGPASRVGPRPFLAAGALTAAVGLIMFSRLGVSSSYLAHVMPAMVVAGLGLGLIFGRAIDTATARVQPRDAGVASAFVQASQQVAGALGVALLNSIAAQAVAAHLPTGRRPTAADLTSAAVAGNGRAFLVAAVIMLAAGVIGWLVVPAGRTPVDEAG